MVITLQMMTIVENMQAMGEGFVHGVIWSHHVWHTRLSECPSPPLPPKVVLHCHVPGLPVHCDCGPAELADCPDEWTCNNFRKMWKAPLSLQDQES